MPREKKTRFGKFERWIAAGILPPLFATIPPLPTVAHFVNCLNRVGACMSCIFLETVADGTDEINRKGETLGYGEVGQTPLAQWLRQQLWSCRTAPEKDEQRAGTPAERSSHPIRAISRIQDRQSQARSQDSRPLATAWDGAPACCHSSRECPFLCAKPPWELPTRETLDLDRPSQERRDCEISPEVHRN
jgi:hypothetical protein